VVLIFISPEQLQSHSEVPEPDGRAKRRQSDGLPNFPSPRLKSGLNRHHQGDFAFKSVHFGLHRPPGTPIGGASAALTAIEVSVQS
jgi:hypothetical protein